MMEFDDIITQGKGPLRTSAGRCPMTTPTNFPRSIRHVPETCDCQQILAEQRAAEQRVIAENRPQWNDAEYFAADDLAVLRTFRTSEMAVVAEDTECGLPVSVRIVRGDSAQDIFEMSRPITCEEINLVVGQLEAEPHAIAIRLLELQRGAELTRAHLEIIERRLGVRS